MDINYVNVLRDGPLHIYPSLVRHRASWLAHKYIPSCRTSGAILWGVETHRLGGLMPPNWMVGEKEGLYRLETGSEIDLVTWQYDLATE